MIMTVWSMHWRLVLRRCLITRSYLENLFLFPNLVSKTLWTFFPLLKCKSGKDIFLSPTFHNLGHLASCSFVFSITCCISAVTGCHVLLPVVSRVVSVLSSVVTRRFTYCLSSVLFKITCCPLFPDMLAVPDFLIGAMEEWGLVMFRRSYLVYDEQFCSTGVKLAMTKVIAHELAHQVIYAANHLVKMTSNIIFQTIVTPLSGSIIR